MKLQQKDVSPTEVSALGQLVMLTQRIGKSANEFLTAEGVNPEAVVLLSKDLNSFNEITKGLLDGNPQMGLPGTRDPQVRERLIALNKQYQETRTRGGVILDNLAGLNAAREAQNTIIGDSEPLRKTLESVQDKLGSETGFSGLTLFMLLLCAILVILGGAGFLRLYVSEQGQRAALAQTRRLEAEGQEKEAKRVNDANQAAILRLMNELQGVAEGDLTQQATVTEDITGAIADSVNYTVEELRTLVSQVQGTVGRVTATTEQVEANSTELLATSSEQLREIRDTGESVLQMAGRINNVSTQAQHTAEVARQSRQAAESGLQAMQNTIGGMNSIRDQIQETSKRIKRLGESSAGDRRNHRTDFRHYRTNQRAGAERGNPGGLRRRCGPRLSRSLPRKCSGWPNARPTRRARSPRWSRRFRPTPRTPSAPWNDRRRAWSRERDCPTRRVPRSARSTASRAS